MPRKRKVEEKSAKDNELSDTLGAVRKRYGDASVRVGNAVNQPDRISTGAFILDFALLGGIPHNRCTMVTGEKSAGKSMLASKIIAGAQAQYPEQTPVIVDVEGTFDAVWAGQLGVDLDNIQVVDCETGEMAVDVTDAVIGSKETSLVVIDSIAALAPMKEIDASAEDNFVGLQARLVGNMIRRVTSSLIAERKRNHYVTVLFINQFRTKIGVMYGDPRTVPGGKALEYSTSVQINMRNKESSGKDDREVEAIAYNEHAFTITKNKINHGPRSGEFKLVRIPDEEYGLQPGDIDDGHTLLAYAKKFGAYDGGGQKWKLEFDQHSYTFGKARDAIAALYEDRDLYWSLRNWIIREQARFLGMPDDFLEIFEV